MFDYNTETLEIIKGLAKNVLNFFEDRKHRWTFDLSNHKGGSRKALSKIKNSEKRSMTRDSFYHVVGAGSPLADAFAKYMKIYTKDRIELTKKEKTIDHINPPQEFGEFFLDKLCGYYTEKDTAIMNLDYIVCCIMFLMKTVEISKTLNSSLRHFTPSTGNGNGIVTIDKYQILNDHVEKFRGKLTLYINGSQITEEENNFLFNCPIDGYVDWQIQKYGAKLFSKNKSETNLCHDQMLDLQSFMS